jgi:3-isopropylmalate/(R)-2-methylmalate dehydratase small subunit
MVTIIKGKAIVLGNNIDTDQIYPGRYLDIVDPKEIGRYCLSGVDAGIAESFEKGGIIVAGTNFGCGSSREHAAIALINMGASLVIAESFARIFFRNAINLGLPLIICKGITEHVKSGQRLSVDIAEGIVTNIDTGKTINAEKISEHALKILEAGGIKPLFQEKYGRKL